jgi:hypothetical protein
VEKVSKTKRGVRMASQPPKGAVSTEQSSGEAKRLRAGWGKKSTSQRNY